MDKLTIQRLEVPVLLGVGAKERQTLQSIWIDLEVPVEIGAAVHSDDITQTLDYTKLRLAILSYAKTVQFALLETFSQRLADHLLQTFCLSGLRLQVHKCPQDMPDIQAVSLTLVRGEMA